MGQSVEGSYREGRTPLPAAERHVLLHRDVPRPLLPPHGGARAGRRSRLKSALSGWYYGDRVPFPGGDGTGQEERHHREGADRLA
ncbi:hypothetical protein AB0F45_38140 [Streptomyces achromogenes]|uniref:hypothetical protein n=1 Tax=Streptomyces achromogenes TaxID=67255 RepID=UPI0033C8C184